MVVCTAVCTADLGGWRLDSSHRLPMNYMSHIAFPSLVTLIRRAIGPSEQGYMQITGVSIPERR